MKRLAIAISSVLMAAVLPAMAQEAEDQQYDYEFNPHWFIQGQLGGQYTLGERHFKDLSSFNAQLGVGYEFSPALAARLSVNAYRSRAGMAEFTVPGGGDYQWDWNYIAPSLDGMLDLSNAIMGFNPERKFGFGVLAGIGANYVFNKDEAVKQRDAIEAAYTAVGVPMSTDYLKNADRAGLFLTGRLGTFVDWHITDKWALGLELQANMAQDDYNSKFGDNTDWYFNGLVGVKYCFGKTHKKTPKEKMVPLSEASNYVDCPDPEEKVVEKVVKEVVEVPVLKTGLREEIYFTIGKDEISTAESFKIRRLVAFMKENPDTKIEISGNADASTGTHEFNQKISESRAKKVAKAITDAGIDESRITIQAYGDTKNIYEGSEMEYNRVAICIIQ